jgi:hypothetical protein
MSRYIKEVHRCERPEILPSQNLGTVWECDCKRRFVVVFSHHNGELGWSPLPEWKFNEAEDRLLTEEEVHDYLMTLAKSSVSPYATEAKKPSLRARLTWRFRR